MGFIFPIILAIGSLVLDDLGGMPNSQAPWAVIALAPVPYIYSWAKRRMALTGKFRWSELLSRLESFIPVLLQYLSVGVFGWMRSLETWFEADLSLLVWPEPEILLALLPYTIYTLAAIDAEDRWSGVGEELRHKRRGFQWRMFLSGLGPIIAYLIAASFLGRWQSLRIGVEEVTLWSFMFTAVLVVGFVILLPLFLRLAWETERLHSGPQFGLLSRIAEMADFRYRELLIWKTGNLMSNASIVGLSAGTRRVFFTDALLRQLDPRQLAAVFAHEIGHAKRHHVQILLTWALAYFAVLDGVINWTAVDHELLEVALLFSGLLMWFWAFGWLSRRIELDADLYCLDLLRDGIGITSALQAVAPSDHGRSGWRHFSTNQRIEFLGRASADPEVGRRLRRRIRLMAFSGLLVLFAAGAWRLKNSLDSYPMERTFVDLRLGHFAQAAGRASTWGNGAQDEKFRALLALVQLAEESDLPDLDSPEEAAAVCAERASRALEGGQADLALGWLSLAGLAGDRQAAWAAEVLRANLEGEPPTPAREGDLGEWQERLEVVLGAE